MKNIAVCDILREHGSSSIHTHKVKGSRKGSLTCSQHAKPMGLARTFASATTVHILTKHTTVAAIANVRIVSKKTGKNGWKNGWRNSCPWAIIQGKRI